MAYWQSMKYTVGAETQTVLNLLDGDGITSRAISAGWQNNNGGEASVNGLNLTDDFDFALLYQRCAPMRAETAPILRHRAKNRSR
jgi:hypothetical protein